MPGSRISTKRKIVYSSIVVLVFLGLCYSVLLLIRSHQLYSLITARLDNWDKRIHEADSDLGYRAVPDSVGVMLNTGNAYDVRYDRHGFRIPLDAVDDGPQRPTLLALGCSFTFGSLCRAEQSYPYILADMLGGRAMNAGVCSYGLAQMLIRGERLIEMHQPDYLVVQYSPWLIARAGDRFASSGTVRIPVPYFYWDQGQARLHPPIYETKAFDLEWEHFGQLPKGMKAYSEFTAQAGLAYSIHEDWKWVRSRFMELAGRIPQPTGNGPAIVRATYGRLWKACQRHGTKMVVVVLNRDAEDVSIFPGTMPHEIPIIHAHAEMLRRLDHADDRTFRLAYGHRLETPHGVMMDEHPNPQAHRLIAEVIFEELTSRGYLQANAADD